MVSYGYCGDGPGYCVPVEPEEEVEQAPAPPRPAPGCLFPPGLQLVGGELGVVTLSPGNSSVSSCSRRCQAHPLCLWFTHEAGSRRCWLKSGRGYGRSRADTFVSGATFR